MLKNSSRGTLEDHITLMEAASAPSLSHLSLSLTQKGPSSAHRLAAAWEPQPLPPSLAPTHSVPSRASTGYGVIFRGTSWLWLCWDGLALAAARLKACLNFTSWMQCCLYLPKTFLSLGPFKDHAKFLVSFIWMESFIRISEGSYSHWLFANLRVFIAFPLTTAWLHIEQKWFFENLHQMICYHSSALNHSLPLSQSER